MRGRCLGALGFGACTERVAPALWLVALVACAATASPPGPAAATRRPSASDEPSVPLRPHVAVVPVDAPAPPPPPPPVIDAEQRVVLDALEAVAAAMVTKGSPREVADTVGRVVTEVERGRFEVEPRDPALTRIDIGRSSATSVAANVTLHTPTSARTLGTQFGVLREFEYPHEFDASLTMVACRALPGGDEIVVMIIVDGHPADPRVVPITAVEITRRTGDNSYCGSR